ncbi:MAG: regulatory protein RecX [Candidatus Omnitrophota bacterium]
MIKEEERLNKARAYAFLLLKFRLRSEREIYSRLKRKKFPEEIIRKTIAFLKEKDFLDDNLFAKAWIESRLKKPFGFRRIAGELRQKGIESQVLERQIEEQKKSFREEEVIQGLISKKIAKLKKTDMKALKPQLYAWLLRRGFSADIIQDELESL